MRRFITLCYLDFRIKRCISAGKTGFDKTIFSRNSLLYSFLAKSGLRFIFYQFLPKLLALFISFLSTIPAVTAQQNLNYAVQANIIYRFTKYIDWPGADNSGDFIIGVVGDTPLFEELASFVANKTVGSRRIILEKMQPAAKFYNCHILFVCDDYSGSIKSIAWTTRGSPVLIISETSSRASKSACINFVIINDHMKLEINKKNIDERNLNIASELLRLGTIVK
ncbi:MAG: YfiR family protein [Ferruginibacter sp.]